MKGSRLIGILLLLTLVGGNAFAASAPKKEKAPKTEKPASEGLKWFYRMGLKMDRWLQRGIDTSYIALPEHSWRLAQTNTMIGVHSTFLARDVHYATLPLGDFTFIMKSRPSVSLGFNAGYRGFGFGYSWDVMNAYSQNWNFSFGSKAIGLEFMRQTSDNISCAIAVNKFDPIEMADSLKLATITNTSFNVWYALNAAHYNHNAAIKQSYIQRKSAGSLLLQVNYMSTDVRMNRDWILFTNQVVGIETHQMGVGLGYGINVTPNHGKVLFHLSGLAQLICISQNLITHMDKVVVEVAGNDTTINLEGLYQVQSRYPVHVSGTMRAAVSWEINKWVHLSAWAKANNIRFSSLVSDSDLSLTNWNWQVNLNIAVRLGAGYERSRKALGDEYEALRELPPPYKQTAKLPQWLTDWFFSPRL